MGTKTLIITGFMDEKYIRDIVAAVPFGAELDDALYTRDPDTQTVQINIARIQEAHIPPFIKNLRRLGMFITREEVRDSPASEEMPIV